MEVVKVQLLTQFYHCLNIKKAQLKFLVEEMKPDSYDIKEKIGVIFQDVAVFDELNVI